MTTAKYKALVALVSLSASLLLPVFAQAQAAVSAAQAKQLRATAYDQSLSIPERLAAIRTLEGYPEGKPIHRKVCIWDPVGSAGPIFTAAQDQRARLLEYGVTVEMVPYTSESVIVEDLKAGICDAALFSGLRARLFNKYTGTVDAIGGLPTQKHMRILLQVLSSPKVADKMVSNDYVIMGIAPGGGAYLFVDDRKINTLANAAGKKVAVLDYDPTQARMVAQVGATPISSDIVSAPNKFNNGVVDVLACPLVAYEPLELYKGMEPNGGIINYPLAQISMQLVGRSDRFPNEIAQLVREAFFQSYDQIIGRLDQEAAKIPKKWWIEIPPKDKIEYETMMQQARIQLRDEGYYDADMLKLERKIRCKLDESRAECANPVE